MAHDGSAGAAALPIQAWGSRHPRRQRLAYRPAVPTGATTVGSSEMSTTRILFSSAQMAACVRLVARILRSRPLMCAFTVVSVICISRAITLFDAPSTSQRRTCVSRWDRMTSRSLIGLAEAKPRPAMTGNGIGTDGSLGGASQAGCGDGGGNNVCPNITKSSERRKTSLEMSWDSTASMPDKAKRRTKLESVMSASTTKRLRRGSVRFHWTQFLAGSVNGTVPGPSSTRPGKALSSRANTAILACTSSTTT